MWRWRRHRTWLVILVLTPTYLSSPTERSRMEPRCAELTPAAAAVPIADCAGLEALPAPIVENLSLSFEGTEAIVCEELLTLTVESGSELSWHLSAIRGDEDGMESALKFRNVRVVVGEGAKLTVGMAVEDANTETAMDEEWAGGDEGQGSTSTMMMTTLTLEGAAPQGSNGGALEVKLGGEAVFLVPVRFAENSVANGYSGGAVHVDGEVTFTHAAHFAGNRAAAPVSEEDRGGATPVTVPSYSVSHSSVSQSVPSPPASPCGGAVSVGKSGRTSFWEFVSFEDNVSEGRGGAVCNRGWTKFFRRSFFNANQAAGAPRRGTSALLTDRDGGLVDGNGGAVYTEEGSGTTFTRRSSMLRNRAAGSGGAVFNAGIVTFETSAEFRGNEAASAAEASVGLDVDFEAGGGHLFNRGFLEIKGDVYFWEGFSGTHGGAVYTISGDDTVLGGMSYFQGNTAGGICDDVLSSVSGSEVKLTIAPVSTSTTTINTSGASSAALPLSTAATGGDVAAMTPGVLAPAFPSPDITNAPLVSAAASASAHPSSPGGVVATAPIGTKPRRRVSRVSPSPSPSASGGDINTTRNSDSHSHRDSAPSRRKRKTPCQPT